MSDWVDKRGSILVYKGCLSCEVQILTRISYICSHPLTGIGGRPLKPAIRVRVSLGVPNGAVDELVELPAFQAGVCGFNPRRHHQK